MTTTSESKALEVLDRVEGEVIDVREADTERLALFCSNLADLRGQLGDAERVVSDELVRRLDRAGEWTKRVGDPEGGHQWEIKAPSPEAGTETYPPEKLEPVLRDLVDAGEIDEAAARRALKRHVIVTLEVPWEDAPKTLLDTASQDPRFVKADQSIASTADGIKRLKKMGPTVQKALGNALERLPTPSRRARVTLKGKR